MKVFEVVKYQGANDTFVWKFPGEDFNLSRLIQEMLQIGIIGKYRGAVIDLEIIGCCITDMCSGIRQNLMGMEVVLAKNWYFVVRRKGCISTIIGIVLGLAIIIVLAFEPGVVDKIV